MDSSCPREELVDQAIQKLLIEMEKMEKSETSSDYDTNQHQLLLSTLLSQLESLKSSNKHMQPKESSESEREDEEEVSSRHEVAKQDPKDEEEPVAEDNGKHGGGNETLTVEEMVKELKAVKRQNLVTHCLLSVMIVLTVAWQLSEVSLILQVKDGLSHPFKSLGNMVFGFLSRPRMATQEEPEEQQSSSKNHQNGYIVSPVPPLKIPDLPHVELGFNGNNHSQT